MTGKRQIAARFSATGQLPLWPRSQNCLSGRCRSTALGNLHQVLQVTFDWCNYHLHEFDFGGEPFGIPDPEFDWEPVRSETRIQLKTALGGMASFKYIYDFGDHWEHRIKIEKKLPGDPELSHRAMLLKAVNATPPGDVGGTPGYADFVAAMTDPNHPEHQSMREWYGDAFDPTFVDVVAISLALQVKRKIEPAGSYSDAETSALLLIRRIQPTAAMRCLPDASPSALRSLLVLDNALYAFPGETNTA